MIPEEEYTVSEKYLECQNPELSGNYTVFDYRDGWLTAYNEDARVEYYFEQSEFHNNFLKQSEPEYVQQLEPLLH